MSAEDEQCKFVEQFVRESLSLPRTVFTSDVVDLIALDFNIPTDKREEAAQILEVGAQQWVLETQRAKLEFEKIRKELRSLERAAKAVREVLGDLSAATTGILLDAGEGRRLGGISVPAITLKETAPALTYGGSVNDDIRCVTLSDIAAIVAALNQCAVDARPMAGANKKGRPENEALFDFLHYAFHVWASHLERDFSLDWATGAEPITDAALFCVRVARTVDPTAPLSEIRTQARKIHERAIEIKDLQNLDPARAHYRKWFE